MIWNLYAIAYNYICTSNFVATVWGSKLNWFLPPLHLTVCSTSHEPKALCNSFFHCRGAFQSPSLQVFFRHHQDYLSLDLKLTVKPLTDCWRCEVWKWTCGTPWSSIVDTVGSSVSEAQLLLNLDLCWLHFDPFVFSCLINPTFL